MTISTEKKRDGNYEVQDQLDEPVKDTYKTVYILHFSLGLGYLLPWNVFITAIDYFEHIYPRKHLEKVFSVAYMSSSLLVLLLLIVRQAKESQNKANMRLRMNLGFSVFVLSMMVAPVIDWTNWRSTQPRGSLTVTVASVVICGLANGLIGGSLIGSAGQLPKEYMQAVFVGNASSGVLVTILRIITKASLPENPKGLQTSAHFYFIVSASILFICMMCSNLLFAMPVLKQHPEHLNHHHHIFPTVRPQLRETAKKILWPAFGIISIYIVTLSIFPGFIADDSQKSEVLRDWYPILLIAAYNLSDLVGKSLTALCIPSNVGKVPWVCLARVLFYPAFKVCIHGPKWLGTEVWMTLLTFMLGVSNGYLTSALMKLTPKTVSTVEAETAAVVMAVCLALGLVGGSLLGWLWII